MAAIVVGLVEALTETSVHTALIQRKVINDDLLNTGWTVLIIQRLFVAIALLPAAHIAAVYFQDDRVIPVLYVGALSTLIGAFENIGIIYFQRDLQFEKTVRFRLTQKFIGFGFTIGFAILLRSYWALVIGSFAMAVSGLALSYALHPYRPRVSFSYFLELWHYSKWMLLSGIIRYIRVKVDQIAIGGRLDSTRMGQYSVAHEIATLPTVEVVVPMTQALFPNFSRLSEHPALLKSAFLKALSVTAIFTAAVGAGLASVADSFVFVVLGPKWVEVTIVVQWLAVFGFLGSLNGLYMPVFMAVGKSKMLAILDAILLVIVVPIIFYAASFEDIATVAAARVFSLFLVTPMIYFFISREIKTRITELVAAVWRPLVSALAMSVVLAAAGHMGLESVILRLAAQVALGAFVYLAVGFLLCKLVGFQDTVEYEVFTILRTKLTKNN